MGWAVAAVAILLAVAAIVLLLRSGGDTGDSSARKSPAKKTGTDASAHRKAAADHRKIASATTQPYSAVAVQPGMSACEAATAMAGIRQLKDSAPSLPLEGCDKAHCHCKLQHYDDRRSVEGDDRRVGFGLQSELYGSSGEKNRRRRRGRRLTDV